MALLSLDCLKLREERDALREDLALLGGHSELPLDSKQLRQDLEMTEKMLRACETPGNRPFFDGSWPF